MDSIEHCGNVMTRDQVRAFDRWVIEQLGMDSTVLMENAGRGCTEWVLREIEGKTDPLVCIFCGTGNNGGDGFVIARHLVNAAARVRVVLCGDRSKVGGDAKANLELLERLGFPVGVLNPSDGGAVESVVGPAGQADLIVDALFGTGLQGELREGYRRLVEAINALDVPILAVDIPSGLDCDSGRPLGAAIRARRTVTFVALKRGFVQSPESGQFTGKVHVASIGVDPGRWPAGPQRSAQNAPGRLT